MNLNHFRSLLEKYLTRTINAEEEMVFMKMVKSSVYDELLKERINDELLNQTEIGDTASLDTKALLDNILEMEKQANHLISLKRRSLFYRSVGIAASVIVLIAGWWHFYGHSKVSPADQDVTSSYTEKHGRQFIRLPDSSTVILNKNSELSYPDVFAKNSREVTIKGEGYFDVRHNARKAFIVHTGKIDITVLGTAFNIKAYPDDDSVTLTVTRGSVEVSNKKQNFGVASADQQIIINTKDYLSSHSWVDADKTIGWKSRYLIMDNLCMKEAAALIGNRYHVNVLFTDERLKHFVISATFMNNENLDQVLKVICGVINAQYTIQPNDQVIISQKKGTNNE